MTDAPRRLDDGLYVICALSWAAGLIHVAAAISHLSEYALFAVFFEVLAITQIIWGIALYRAPSRRLLIGGAIANLVVVALWVVSRTAGVPLGPHPWRPEVLGALDAICSADEAILALLVALYLRNAAHVARALATGVAVLLLVISSLALTGAGQGHLH